MQNFNKYGFLIPPDSYITLYRDAVLKTTQERITNADVVVDDLQVPWDFIFLPGDVMLVTERTGGLIRVISGKKQYIYRADVYGNGEGGLLGITRHPDFADKPYVYLYHTYRVPESGAVHNRVQRHRYVDDILMESEVLLDNIPGAKYHNGGRMAFGPDGMLYVTTGDAGEEDLAQDITSLAGKILRIRDDGTVPDDNPFPESPVYSYGHRNPQGITWDADGNLWSTEHGRSGIRSGFDEVNLIKPGGNYGWPGNQGDTAEAGTEAPKLHSGPKVTWAPASAVYHNNRIYFGGLRGEAIYAAVPDGQDVVSLEKLHHAEFGRIRTVKVGSDGMLYFTTSNRDGRGSALSGDDVLARIPFPSAE